MPKICLKNLNSGEIMTYDDSDLLSILHGVLNGLYYRKVIMTFTKDNSDDTISYEFSACNIKTFFNSKKAIDIDFGVFEVKAKEIPQICPMVLERDGFGAWITFDRDIYFITESEEEVGKRWIAIDTSQRGRA